MTETIVVGITCPRVRQMMLSPGIKLTFPLGKSGWVLVVLILDGVSIQVWAPDLNPRESEIIGAIGLDAQLCGAWLWRIVDKAVRERLDPGIGSLLPSERSKVHQVPGADWPGWAGISEEVERLAVIDSVMEA